MKNLFLLAGILSTGILCSCGGGADSDADGTDTTATPPVETVQAAEGTLVATANLMSTADSTQNIGTAKFYKLDSINIRLDVAIDDHSRADSNVAVHFHEHGDCGDKGNNTHGHWNPTKQNHGEWGSAAFHLGDIGNIKLDASGHGSKSITTDKWSIVSGTPNYIIGLGVIVHGGTDDYTSQPTGNSGPRTGCGVIMLQ
ncbi:MAG TPA: superoxide dismutase family protein [Niabella sp.]|nr:superoxide dismutase family protein [Niabella sp.]HQW15073.1 superoxide dismutase family protein [Niabella sp.]HQX20214.1 superoxide dismutase family protein [Niabella sp.]HQX41293.1 superoxide dismutase family protein [Niabella sp.]HRB35526.1 superoxide dismutase family protein [Niabella sp.]